MKKVLVILISIVLLTNLLIATDFSAPTKEQVNAEIQNVSSKINLESNKTLSPEVEKFGKAFFGLDSTDPLSLRGLIVLCALSLLVFLIVFKVTKFLPFVKGTITRITVSVIVIILASIGGGIKSGVHSWAILLGFFNILENSPIFSIITIILLIILYLIISKFSKSFEETQMLIEAKTIGRNLKRGADRGKNLSDIFENKK